MPAIPGMEPPIQALCVAPFGMEEGSELELPGQQFGLVTGEPVHFRFFACPRAATTRSATCSISGALTNCRN